MTEDIYGIADPDGLISALFTHQWLPDDVEINNATALTYVPDADDDAETIRVRVSFPNDAGNGETLTSAATTAVPPR